LSFPLPFAVSPRSISVLLDNRWRSIDASHANYKALYEALKAPVKDLDLIRRLIDIPSFIAKASFGRVQVGGDSVRFDGKDISGVYVQRLLDLLRDGFDIEPLARYLEKREQNPVFTAREELDLFFANAETAIASDGDVFVFKKVQDDYTSYHQGRDGKIFTHTIGSVVEIDENQVDLDRSNTCSSGLHFCSYHYLKHYHGGVGRVVILKLNPADVRAIPNDYNNAKGRAVRYTVVGEVPEEEAKQFFEGQPIYFGFDYASGDDDESYFVEDYDKEIDWSEQDSENDIFADEEPPKLEPELTVASTDVAATEYGPVPAEFDVDQARIVIDIYSTFDDRVVAIGNAFTWDSSQQGFAFWSNEKELLRRGYSISSVAVKAIESFIAAVEDETQAINVQVFRTRDGRLFTADEIVKLVQEHGQRGFARVTGVPRTTVQEWLKQIVPF